MPRNMKPPMMSAHFLTSFFAVLVFLAISAQARTLPESPGNKFKLLITYGRALSLPPPSPTTSPPTHQIQVVTSISTCTAETQCTNFIGKSSYERPLNSPPPPPNSAPAPHQIKIDYGRAKSPSPPPPKSSSSPVQIEIASPCVAGSPCKGVISMTTDYKRPSKSPPPPPNKAPPTHPVTSDEQIIYRSSPPNSYLASS